MLLAAEEGFHAPSLEELFEWPAFWWSEGWQIGNIPLGVNRTTMLVFIAVVVLAALLVGAFRGGKVVPTKFQAAMEAVVGFVRNNIAGEVIGHGGERFVPLLTTIFLFVWFNNFYEILPFVNFPPTGRMAIPAFLAFVAWSVFILVGMKEQGPLRYFKNVAIPGGVPGPILVLVIPIEIVSTFIVRPLTLAIRLFANMMAGHILLAIIFIAANAFLLDVANGFTLNLRGLPVGLVALVLSPAIVGFELMVGALQAYIFTILTAVYIGGALHPEH